MTTVGRPPWVKWCPPSPCPLPFRDFVNALLRVASKDTRMTPWFVPVHLVELPEWVFDFLARLVQLPVCLGATSPAEMTVIGLEAG